MREMAAPVGTVPDTALFRLLDHVGEGVLLCDGAATVRYLNPAASAMLPDVRPGSPKPDGLTGREVTLGDGLVALYLDRVDSAAAFLAATAQRLGGQLNAARVCRATVELAVGELAAAALLVLPTRRGRVRCWHAAGAQAVRQDQATLADLPGAVRDTLDGHPVAQPFLWPGGTPYLGGGDANPAAWVVPIQAASGRSAALIVTELGDGRVELLEEFAARVGAALEAAQLYAAQSRVAVTLQESLRPEPPAPVKGLAWGTAYRPARAAMRIGGDFYGAHPIAGGGSVFYLGDVSGKGVDAAVLTGQVRHSLRALRRVEGDPQRLLHLLNDMLLEGAHDGRFATMILGTAHPRPGGGVRLTLAGGGHLPPLILRGDGTVDTLALRGMLVGVTDEPVFGQREVHLAAGESCLLYTDGVTEARGGHRGDEMYGLRRLTGAVSGCAAMPAPALAERVEQVTADWLGGRDHDDIAALVVRAEPVRTPSRHLYAVQRPVATVAS
ncbi:SpoIIE family protein phosphatase [Dactylosporangium vinaceum]|uniref:SpoIIE family protein phosphatase n=1 Tax=Dactylosporangium vinaceum TaxID=53362 RepID=A0ABV5M8F8_9ACTN|nr:SpoIIE family protein phosphatase [Dactylosporangium vinaceum]UAB94225.1 SpoIIE family protein phosphatase [Dactylosporangium vinaceum]